jgi:hypothetical protein
VTTPAYQQMHGRYRRRQAALRNQPTQGAGQAARGAAVFPLRGAQKVTGAGGTIGRYSARGLLTAELLAGAGLVALRAVSDYEPQADGTLKGKIGHPTGQYGPLPILAGLIGSFFLLSFLAARGGTRGKVAVAAGALIILVLGLKSVTEVETVADTFGTFGKAKVPAGDWQTTGTAAGEPVTGSTSSSGSSSESGSSGGGESGLPPALQKAPVQTGQNTETL